MKTEQYATKEQMSDLLTVKEFESAMEEYGFAYSFHVVQCEHLAKARDNVSKQLIRKTPNYKADPKIHKELLDNARQRSEYLKFGILIAQMEQARQVEHDNYGIIEQVLDFEKRESEYQANY